MKLFRATIPASVLISAALAAVSVAGCEKSAPPVVDPTHSTTPAAAHTVDDATLTDSPNPVPVNSKSTTIRWSVGSGTTGQVYIAEDGGPEKLFAEDRKGEKLVNWITRQRYDFRLYAGKDHKTELASVVVIREPVAVQVLEKK